MYQIPPFTWTSELISVFFFYHETYHVKVREVAENICED